MGSRSLAVLLLFPALVACNNSGPSRWCEYDDTDEVVADQFCIDRVPGYEWEPDGDDHDSGVVFIPPVNHGTPKTYKPAPTYKAPTYKPPAPVVKSK